MIFQLQTLNIEGGGFPWLPWYSGQMILLFFYPYLLFRAFWGGFPDLPKGQMATIAMFEKKTSQTKHRDETEINGIEINIAF